MKGRNGKGEGLPRVLTMVKTAPLGIASRRKVKNPNSRCLVLKKWARYKPISLSILPFMLCEPNSCLFCYLDPKSEPKLFTNMFLSFKKTRRKNS